MFTTLGLIAGPRLTDGDPRGTLAILTAVFGVGQIIGPAFAGAIYDATGSFTLPSMAAAGALYSARCSLLGLVNGARSPFLRRRSMVIGYRVVA